MDCGCKKTNMEKLCDVMRLEKLKLALVCVYKVEIKSQKHSIQLFPVFTVRMCKENPRVFFLCRINCPDLKNMSHGHAQ